MNAGFYKLSRTSANQLYAIFRLGYDVEITTFREDGRDITFKALQGDYLAFCQDNNGSWIPVDGCSLEQAEDDFVPVGDV